MPRRSQELRLIIIKYIIMCDWNLYSCCYKYMKLVFYTILLFLLPCTHSFLNLYYYIFSIFYSFLYSISITFYAYSKITYIFYNILNAFVFITGIFEYQNYS